MNKFNGYSSTYILQDISDYRFDFLESLAFVEVKTNNPHIICVAKSMQSFVTDTFMYD